MSGEGDAPPQIFICKSCFLIMSKKILTCFALFLTVIFYACNSKDKSAVQDENANLLPVFEFSSEDSLKVNELAEQYVACFNANDLETAADMLYTVRNDSVFPLTAEQKSSFMAAMSQLPKFGFQKKELTLKSDLDNKVRVAVLMSENGSLEEEKATINLFVNPVKIEGQWYLTVYDRYAEGVGQY